VAKDMVDMLLEIACDPNLEVPIDRDRVRAFIQVSPYISVATLFSKGTFLIDIFFVFHTLNRATKLFTIRGRYG
jgi:hypothetical protein